MAVGTSSLEFINFFALIFLIQIFILDFPHNYFILIFSGLLEMLACGSTGIMSPLILIKIFKHCLNGILIFLSDACDVYYKMVSMGSAGH